MNLEEKLKTLILSRYGTLKNFVPYTGLTYSTVDTILRRGLNKAAIDNVIKICKALEISVDDLAEGRIVSVSPEVPSEPDLREIPVKIMYARQNLHDCDKYSIYGKPLTILEAEILLDALDFAVRLVKRLRDE